MRTSNIPWLLVVLLLIFVLPIGVVLLIIKLSEGNTRTRRTPQTWRTSADAPKQWQQPQPRPPVTPPPTQSAPRPEQPSHQAPPAPPKPRDAMDAKLLALRGSAQNIVSPRMQLKAGSICNTVEKVFDHVRKHPEKQAKLTRFEEYYLPTTQRLLERYGELEKQPHPGDNITRAIGQIDDVMDSIDNGFKLQLDQLFSADAMDISADVKVMEQLFAKDGLQEDAFPFEQKISS